MGCHKVYWKVMEVTYDMGKKPTLRSEYFIPAGVADSLQVIPISQSSQDANIWFYCESASFYKALL